MAQKIKKRSEADERYMWRITDLMESYEIWEKKFTSVKSRIPEITKYSGRLREDGQLLKLLTESGQLSNDAEAVYVYAHLRLKEDNGNSFYQGLADRADLLITELSSKSSFIETEIIELGEEKVREFIAREEGLKLYSHYLEDLFRLKEHVLSKELEEVLAKTGELADAPSSIFTMLNNADMKFSSVRDDMGAEVELTHGRYMSLMESKSQSVRKGVFEAYYESYINIKNTLAKTYSASVKKDVFYSKMRKYNSCLEMSLNGNNIDTAVYKNLIKAVENNLGYLHKYVDLRKKALALDEIHMYDLYTPIVKEADTKITFESARDTVVKALAPLGTEYCRVLENAMKEGWLDVYENQGKDSGAFSWGTYSCHPFVLLNFDDKINDMFTLAHEMGHAIHSYYTSKNQPYVYGNYTLFVAEVASTVNEALLMEYLLKNTRDRTMNKYLINYYMEQFRGTLFRQTMFAEFELWAHETAEADMPLTTTILNEKYRELNRKYYGNNIILDSQIDYEWSRIPHFYRAYYVYQYATGYSAATALSRRILEQGEAAVSDYIDFLSSGSRDYPLNLLKKAGADMSKPEPVEMALNVFGELLDKFNEFL